MAINKPISVASALLALAVSFGVVLPSPVSAAGTLAPTPPVVIPSIPPDPAAVAKLTPAERAQMEDELKAGNEAAAEVAKSAKISTDPVLNARISAIGARIAAIASTTEVPAHFGTSTVYPFHFTYTVIDEKEVNAFSLPGGHIFIYKGLLNLLTTDDEIAGVLGHETAHAAHHHVMELMHQANKMNTATLLGALAAVLAHVPAEDLGSLAVLGQSVGAAVLNNHYSEAAEEDADHTGMIYMKEAGYNPVGMLALMYQLKSVDNRSPDIQLGYLQDHPLTSQRIEAAKAELRQLDVPVTPASMNTASGNIASVVDKGKASDVEIAGQVVFRVSSDDEDAAQDAAQKLNDLLGQNLQQYEVKAIGAELVARSVPVIEFSDADVGAQQLSNASETPGDLAKKAAHTLQLLLWNKVVTTPSEQEIEVDPTNPYDPTER